MTYIQCLTEMIRLFYNSPWLFKYFYSINHILPIIHTFKITGRNNLSTASGRAEDICRRYSGLYWWTPGYILCIIPFRMQSGEHRLRKWITRSFPVIIKTEENPSEPDTPPAAGCLRKHFSFRRRAVLLMMDFTFQDDLFYIKKQPAASGSIFPSGAWRSCPEGFYLLGRSFL